MSSVVTMLADFASEAVGGIVIDTPNTESYYNPSATQLTWFGIPVWKPNYFTPRKVIQVSFIFKIQNNFCQFRFFDNITFFQPWTQPGECWAFRGSHGKIEIQLAHAAIIEKVTLEHITASASLTRDIDSAPKIFNILVR